MEKTQSDQPEKCSKCNNFPEDILMLACGHDLCLLCAAKVFQKSENAKYSRPTSSLVCEICGMSTHLDQSSVYELEKILISNNLSSSMSVPKPQSKFDSNPAVFQSQTQTQKTLPQSKTPNRFRDSADKMTKKEEILVKNTERSEKLGYNLMSQENSNRTLGSFSNTTPMLKAVKGFCPEHPDEEISYFCFNCVSNCICPECIIHGVHKNHEVMTIKRSYPIIKNKIDEFVKQLNLKIDDFKNGQDSLRTKKREHFDQNKHIKKAIAEFFGELRNKIDLKEKEIIKATDITLDNNIKEIDGEITVIENNITQLFSELDNINNHLNAKDEALLLNFYANQGKNIEKNLFTPETIMQKLEEPNLFDVKDLEQQISSLCDQVISLNPQSLQESNKLMHSISKSPNQLFSNMKYSPISKKLNNDENAYDIDKNERFSNLKGSVSQLNYESKPPKGLNMQVSGKIMEKKSELISSKSVLKPYNV